MMISDYASDWTCADLFDVLVEYISVRDSDDLWTLVTNDSRQARLDTLKHRGMIILQSLLTEPDISIPSPYR